MVTVLGQRFCDALCLANALHAEQRRKVSGAPYVSHVLAVASLVIENDGSEDESIAALLHDAAEDCGGQQTLQKIRNQFGSVVAEIVLGCSDTLESPKPPWRQRKQHHLVQLAVAERSVKLVSLADKLHNLRTSIHGFTMYGDPFWENFHGGREGLLWYYEELMRVFERSNLPAPLLLDFAENWRRLTKLLNH
jgi:(p)ppGpp synthase/HD superfamily hydrolase